MADAATPVRTYEIALHDGGTLRVDIPESWKVTFGPIAGAGEKGGGYTPRTLAFRAWEAETKQRLLLSGVTSFRDVSLPITVAAVRRFGSAQDQWFADDGSWHGKKGEQVEKGWRPIDEIIEDPESQPSIDDTATGIAWPPPRAKSLRRA